MITVVDSTLRDGSHAKSHRFTTDDVRAVVDGLDNAGVPVIEVSHGDGLGGSSINYGFSAVDELELIAAAVATARRSRVAVLLLPGIGTREDIERARDLGASVVRVATHCTEADIAEQHLQLGRELGMTTIGFLMMAHMVEASVLVEQARIMEGAGAEVIYCTDSAGSLLPHQVHDRAAALRAGLADRTEIGFHGHMNLALGVANTLAAIDGGATWVDACTRAMGAGSGNTPTEVLAAVLDRAGVDAGLDARLIMDVAEDIVRPLQDRPPVLDRSSLLLGYAGVYSSFLLHAERAARRFDVPTADILVEVGRRKAVGGQEDLVTEVALELAADRRQATR